jgi:hypothetical protein
VEVAPCDAEIVEEPIGEGLFDLQYALEQSDGLDEPVVGLSGGLCCVCEGLLETGRDVLGSGQERRAGTVGSTPRLPGQVDPPLGEAIDSVGAERGTYRSTDLVEVDAEGAEQLGVR